MTNNCPNHADIKEMIQRNANDLREVAAAIQELQKGLSSVEGSAKSLHKRQDSFELRLEVLERSREEIGRMVACMESLSKSVDRQNQIAEILAADIQKLRGEVQEVRSSPGKYALTLVQVGVAAAVGSIVVFLLKVVGIF